MSYLTGMGYQRIAYIGGPRELKIQSRPIRRV